MEKQLSISFLSEVMVEQQENKYNPFENTVAVRINIVRVLVEEEPEVIT